MPNFTLRQLEYFVAACEAGSVTLAAQRIPVSQSSISNSIAQLEATLGMQLLIRHHAQGVSPTPEGHEFLPRARALLRDAGELERFASQLTLELSGVLELGCMVTLGPLVAPRLCQDFMARHPAVTIELFEGGPEELAGRLRAGLLSLAIAYDLDPGHEDMEFEGLIDLPPFAVLAEEHRLADRAEVTLAELAEERLVLLDLPLSREYFRALFAVEGLKPLIGYRSPRPETIRTLVANGFGYTLVNARPRIDQALDGRALRSVPIAGRPRPRTLGIATVSGAKPTRLVTAFRDYCRDRISPTSVPGLRVDSDSPLAVTPAGDEQG
jgi:DNA-binding transcriptional LysR family regulator